jgi:hypothetical protein
MRWQIESSKQSTNKQRKFSSTFEVREQTNGVPVKIQLYFPPSVNHTLRRSHANTISSQKILTARTAARGGQLAEEEN